MVSFHSYILKNFLVLEFDGIRDPLYSAAHNDFFHKLSSLVSSIQSESERFAAIYLIQTSAASDYSHEWYNYIARDALKLELSNLISKWRNLGSQIKSCKIPWIYCSDSDCLGSFFELAAFCSYRIWFKPEANIGFPELRYGYFPVLGALEQRPGWATFFKGAGDHLPILTAKQGVDCGLIHRCLKSRNWRQRLTNSLHSSFLNIQSDRVNPLPKFYEKKQGQLAVQSKQLKKLDIDEISREMHKKSPFLYDYFHNLPIKETSQDHFLTNGIIVNQASTQIFHANYLSHYLRELESRNIQNKDLSHDYITIDISESPPPKSALQCLYRCEKPLIFISEETHDLIRNLEITYHRFSQLLTEFEAKRFWETKVSWAKALPSKQTLTFKWEITQDLTVQIKGQTLHLINLERNASSYSPSWYELPAAGKISRLAADDLSQISSFFSTQVVSTTGIGNDHLPLAHFIRWSFFHELVSLCSHQQLPLDTMLKDLFDHGWGFVAIEDNWEHFISHSRTIYTPTESEKAILGRYPDIYRHEIYSWAQLQDLLLHDEDKEKRKSATENSLHLAYFSVLLTIFTIECLSDVSPQLINHFVREILGFSSTLISPLDFFNKIGSFKFKHIINQIWPKSPGPDFAKLDGKLCPSLNN